MPAPTPPPPTESRLDAGIVLAFIFLIAAVLFILAFVTIPKENEVLFGALASGVLGSSITAYVNYRWGSSASSKSKDATIATMAQDAGAGGAE